jgi:hypothetical protein
MRGVAGQSGVDGHDDPGNAQGFFMGSIGRRILALVPRVASFGGVSTLIAYNEILNED